MIFFVASVTTIYVIIMYFQIFKSQHVSLDISSEPPVHSFTRNDIIQLLILGGYNDEYKIETSLMFKLDDYKVLVLV